MTKLTRSGRRNKEQRGGGGPSLGLFISQLATPLTTVPIVTPTRLDPSQGRSTARPYYPLPFSLPNIPQTPINLETSLEYPLDRLIPLSS